MEEEPQPLTVEEINNNPNPNPNNKKITSIQGRIKEKQGSQGGPGTFHPFIW